MSSQTVDLKSDHLGAFQSLLAQMFGFGSSFSVLWNIIVPSGQQRPHRHNVSCPVPRVYIRSLTSFEGVVQIKPMLRVSDR